VVSLTDYFKHKQKELESQNVLIIVKPNSRKTRLRVRKMFHGINAFAKSRKMSLIKNAELFSKFQQITDKKNMELKLFDKGISAFVGYLFKKDKKNLYKRMTENSIQAAIRNPILKGHYGYKRYGGVKLIDTGQFFDSIKVEIEEKTNV
jgi:hypothetical protein